MILIVVEPGIREQVNELFNIYLQDGFSNSGMLVGIGRSFAAMGIAIAAFMAFKDENKRWNIWEYVKWIPLFLLLVLYPTVVKSIFDFYELIGLALQRDDILWDDIYAMVFAAMYQAEENISPVEIISLNVGLDDIKNLFLTSFIRTLVFVSSAVSTIVFVGIKALSTVYLYIMIIFGPLNIGLSFIPAFGGMWKQWLQKFMSISLWIPMLYLIDNFLLGIMNTVVTNLFQGVYNAGETMTASSEVDDGLVLTGALLIFMNVFIYLKAPQLANFVVQGMDVGAKQLASSPKKYGKKGAKAALAAKTGGTSAAVTQLMH